MTTGTLCEVRESLRAGSSTSTALITESLQRADDHDATLGVFLARFDATATEAARAADTAHAEGHEPGALRGVPVGVKDLLATREGPTTGQSLVVPPNWGTRDAESVARLRAAGAVILGKTSLLELAYGTHYPSHPFPTPANPWNPRTWPGGSSSGSAAGVAAGMMLGSVGTDTGGSIRVPAAMCGVTGIKPTYGLVPVDGCFPLSWSQDHVGPLARSAEDCRVLLEVMSDRPLPRGLPLSGRRIGVDRMDRITRGGGDPAVDTALDAALAVLEGLGAHLVDVTLPWWPEVTDASFLTVATERMAVHRGNLPHRWQDYGRSARLGLARAAYYSGADHVQAQRVRELARRQVDLLFEDLDLVVTPMCSTGAPLLEDLDAFMATWKQLVHASYWDALGNPAASVPMGFTASGLPLGLQVVGAPHADAAVLDACTEFQEATDWHRWTPPTGAET